MAAIKWTQKMSVGVPELDDDHKRLLALINELAAQTSEETDQEALRRSLNWLLRYAQIHFAREQAVMTCCQYPLLPAHIAEHRKFLARMRETVAAFDDDPADTTAQIRDDLIAYLKGWWRHHILSEDRKYKSVAEKNLRAARRAARDVRGYEIWWS